MLLTKAGGASAVHAEDVITTIRQQLMGGAETPELLQCLRPSTWTSSTKGWGSVPEASGKCGSGKPAGADHLWP